MGHMRKRIKTYIGIFAFVIACIMIPSMKLQVSAAETDIASLPHKELQNDTAVKDKIAAADEIKRYKFTTDSTVKSPTRYYLDVKTSSESELSMRLYYKTSWGYQEYRASNWASKGGTPQVQSGVKTVRYELNDLSLSTTYYLAVSGDASVAYELKLHAEKDDYADEDVNAKRVTIGSTVTGRSGGPRDVDYAYVTTGSNLASYKIKIENKSVKWASNLSTIVIPVDEGMKSCILVKIIDANSKNTVFNSNFSLPAGSSKTFTNITLQKNHKYYIMVTGLGIGDYAYTLTKVQNLKEPEVVEDTDQNRTPSQAVTLKLNKSVTYKIDNSVDVDYYKFKTSSYREYKMLLKNISSTGAVNGRLCYDKDCKYTITTFSCVKGKSATQNVYAELMPNTTYYLAVSGLKKGSYTIGVQAYGPESVKAVSAARKKATITFSKISGATSYEIYRATSKSGTYKKVKTISSASARKWTDSNLKSGRIYYYKVRAYNKTKKVYTAFSAIKTVKVK